MQNEVAHTKHHTFLHTSPTVVATGGKGYSFVEQQISFIPIQLTAGHIYP